MYPLIGLHLESLQNTRGWVVYLICTALVQPSRGHLIGSQIATIGFNTALRSDVWLRECVLMTQHALNLLFAISSCAT